MFDKNAISLGFSRAALDYDEHAQVQQAVLEEAAKYAAALWKSGSHILDAGSGTGCFSQTEEAAEWRIIELDAAFGMCLMSPGEHKINASVEAMPFTDNSFDGVFSSLMLQWCAEPLPVFKEISRVLKPGGSALIATFVDGTLKELKEAFKAVDNSEHVSHFGIDLQLTALAAHAGFTLLGAEEETITVHYPDTLALMRSLQYIGATNKLSARKKSLMTPRQMKALEAAYRKNHDSNKGLPATWQVLYMALRKA